MNAMVTTRYILKTDKISVECLLLSMLFWIYPETNKMIKKTSIDVNYFGQSICFPSRFEFGLRVAELRKQKPDRAKRVNINV